MDSFRQPLRRMLIYPTRELEILSKIECQILASEMPSVLVFWSHSFMRLYIMDSFQRARK